MKTSSLLIQKYNKAIPRYTSYPTVPMWDEATFDLEVWKSRINASVKEDNQNMGISLYLHLPFCEQLCTFCGCNKRITKRHEVEPEYINAVLKEWQMYLALMDEKPLIAEIHLGGGTPTFFSPENLAGLIAEILKSSNTVAQPSFSLEGHPNNTTAEHLKALHALGFSRVSFGVQDYDAKVQEAIHRKQSFEQVLHISTIAKKIGYQSVGHDLVFGLPFQNQQGFADTIQKTIQILPDRIALYSYAHVPWIKGNGQRGFQDADIPKDDEKRALYEMAKEQLENAGYLEVGMDHFALPSDALFQVMKEGKLHRNFMGYTETRCKTIIGLGVSSIGDTWNAFNQNEKILEDYYQKIAQNELPIIRGHLLSPEDELIRKHILQIMCTYETQWGNDLKSIPEFENIYLELTDLQEDGLIVLSPNGLQVTPVGKAFLRNICVPFDLRLKRSEVKGKLFSQSV